MELCHTGDGPVIKQEENRGRSKGQEEAQGQEKEQGKEDRGNGAGLVIVG